MVKRAMSGSVLGSWRVYSLLVPLPCVNSLSFWKVGFCFKNLEFCAWFRETGQITLLCRGEFSSKLSALRFKHQRSPRRPHSNQADFIFSYFQLKEVSHRQNYGALDPRIIMRYFEWTGHWLLGEIFHQPNKQHNQVPPTSVLRDWN